MNKIRIFDISLTKAGFVLFLSKNKGDLVLPIVIGISEAQSITLALNGIAPERPLSHDLFCSIMRSTQISVIKVIISRLENNTYYADLYIQTNDGVLIMDSRPSDAIALAIRHKAPIYVSEKVMAQAATPLPEGPLNEYTPINHAEMDIAPVTERDILSRRLDDAVKAEKYEEAAIIRDQLENLNDAAPK